MPRRLAVALVAALFGALSFSLVIGPGATATAEELQTSSFVVRPGLIVGGTVTTHTHPWSTAPVVRTLGERTQVGVLAVEYGENWVVGDQTWQMANQDWGNVWYLLDDGSYVYSAFVFVLSEGEVDPLYNDPVVAGYERYIVIDLSNQLGWAMIGPDVAHQFRITSGKAGFATPAGEFRIFPWGRVASERMRSQSVGITDPNEFYDVQRVLFTQYFAEGGFALHMNYWQPYSVFGVSPSSHGCVGTLVHDAQYLWLFAEPGMRVSVRP